jgi:hypothetical protein
MKPNNISRAKEVPLHTLQGNAYFTTLPADKDNTMAILNTLDYMEKV